MPTPTWYALPGVAFGLALACAVAAFAQPAPIRLSAALARLNARDQMSDDPDTRLGRYERWLVPLAVRAARSSNRWWGLPTRDLDACGLSPTRYLGRRIAWAGSSAALAAVLWLVLAAGGVGLAAGVLVFAVALGAIAGSAVPVLELAETARKRRDEFRRSIAAYLDLVAQERASGAAAGPALIEAARVADSWPFRSVHAALLRAEHAGDTPWEALVRLAARMGVPELGDVADIAAAAADGAAVYSALTTKARGLRHATLAADRADANSRSQRLALSVTLLLIGFVLLAFYPALIRLLSA